MSEDDVRAVKRLCKLLQKKLADRDYLLGVLWFINKDHLFFSKDYTYMKPKPLRAKFELSAVNNTDGFYDGIPEPKKKKKGPCQLRMSKQERKQMTLFDLE